MNCRLASPKTSEECLYFHLSLSPLRSWGYRCLQMHKFWRLTSCHQAQLASTYIDGTNMHDTYIFNIFFYFGYASTWECVYAHECPQWSVEGVESLAVGVRAGCKLPDLGDVNQPFGEAVTILNHRSISPATHNCLITATCCLGAWGLTTQKEQIQNRNQPTNQTMSKA